MQKLSALVLGHKLFTVLMWLVLTVGGLWATVSVGDELGGQIDQPGQPAFEANQAIMRTYGVDGNARAGGATPGTHGVNRHESAPAH